jgi:glutamate 5-kinase
MENTIQVVKIGTKCIFQDEEINRGRLKELAYQIAALKKDRGIGSICVVSGAIPLGVAELGYDREQIDSLPPKQRVKALQRAACVGQKRLMAEYDKAFEDWAYTSQLLVTYKDLEDAQIEAVIEERVRDDVENGIVSLVNYNDGIDPCGIVNNGGKNGILDNDELAGRIARYLHADRLIMLTDVDGLNDGEGQLVDVVKSADHPALAHALGPTANGRGGMKSKVQVGVDLMGYNIETIVGNVNYPIDNLIFGRSPRTLFTPF